MSTQQAGLCANGERVPLEHVEVFARVRGLCCSVRVVQRYRNAEPREIEAVYVFPLGEGAAVCGFSARVGDRVRVEGEVDEREAAFARYDDAVARGDGAFLLEQERPDVFTCSVGNLRPGECVEVAIEYVALLGLEGEAVRFALPTTVAPRYMPPPREPEVGQPAAERVQAPVRDAGVPYGLALRVEVSGLGPLAAVRSPSHEVRVERASWGATIALTSDEVALDRDVVLLIEPEHAHRPHALVAVEEDGTRVAAVTFVPEFDPAPGEVPASEVLFVLDCSGSMRGDSIAQARRALGECVRSLGQGDAFNVVCFGNSHRPLWPEARRVTPENSREALAWLERVDADLGGTELLGPLTFLFARPPEPGRARRVLLLTDGQVGNDAELIALCAAQRDTRMFVFGIGSAPSEHLVRELARVTGGAAEFIAQGEPIGPKVERMFTRVHTPVTRVEVDWGEARVEQEPAECPPLFSGDALTLFARVVGGRATSVRVRAGENEWVVPLEGERVELGGPVPVLWARERLRALERRRPVGRNGVYAEGARGPIEAAIVELAQRYRLLSSQTSFVAVETREGGERSRRPAQLRRVPVAAAAGAAGARGAQNAGPIPVELRETELFGCARGSFTGKVSYRTGLIEESEGGTLYLYGVETLTPKVLRTLWESLVRGEVRHVGEQRTVKVDVLGVLAMPGDPATVLPREIYQLVAHAVVRLPAPGTGRPLAEWLGLTPSAPGLAPDEIELLQALWRIAARREPVLLVGARSDAEAVARRLHALSARSGPFVPIDLSGP